MLQLRRVVAAFLGASVVFAIAGIACAQEVETRALQVDLAALGLYSGPKDGEYSPILEEAIAAYVRQSGFRAPPAIAFRRFGDLVRDVDLEVRIRSGAARRSEIQTVHTRYGALEIATYVVADGPRPTVTARRASIGGARVDVGLAAFSSCCDAKVFALQNADIVVLQGTVDSATCPAARIYVTIEEKSAIAGDGEDSCAIEPAFSVADGRLVVTAQSRTSLLDSLWTVAPGSGPRFERQIVAGALDPLVWWVGKQPWERNERNYRFFHFAPLADAIAGLFEPEALGWALKMHGTSLVERRGDLLFVTGNPRDDENVVTVTVDVETRAVHVCSYRSGIARFASTSLRGVFSDPAASCPADAASAESVWRAFGLTRRGTPARVLGIEGSFGDIAACRAGGDRVTRIATRALRIGGEPECGIDDVAIADGTYILSTTCRVIPVRRLDEDRIDLDGDVLQRCPE